MSDRWDDAERAALVALLRTRPSGLSWRDLAHEVEQRESALRVWEEHHPPGLFDETTQSSVLDEAQRDVRSWHELGFLTFMDELYPPQLREIHDFPPVLFHQGTLPTEETGIAVVGSRRASDLGLQIARAVATGLADRGIAVISGLAKGIDTAAHTAALDAGGRTAAVIGTRITRHYPAENRELQERIAAEGVVISQFWPDAAPTKQSFPMRNAVMSGYSRATIVIEAGEHSGARIQARQAVAHGRPVILTDLVVHNNTWPADLIDQPGVHVASSTAEVIAAAEQVVSGPAEITLIG
ncbi:DNA-processing protein DprA [Amycolatopsis sp. NPDC051071]|uniref:DNA-processing protein DprA n=1 Tax=Amycolatopsis sp. NPDC051071 TaxID=3154637 RepID=UPI00342E515B